MRLRPLAIVAAVLLAILTSGCMRARFKREYRKPWSRKTKVIEDAVWTVESAALGLGGVAVTILTLGLVNPPGLESSSEDEEFWIFGDEAEENPYGGAAKQGRTEPRVPPRSSRHTGTRSGSRSRGGHGVPGTRTSP